MSFIKNWVTAYSNNKRMMAVFERILESPKPLIIARSGTATKATRCSKQGQPKKDNEAGTIAKRTVALSLL